MPIYEYKCENGHLFEAIQKFSDDALTDCEVCGAPVQRVLHSPAIHFKGSGFHNTDYGKGKRGSGGSGADSGAEGDSASGSSSSDGGSSDSEGSEKQSGSDSGSTEKAASGGSSKSD